MADMPAYNPDVRNPSGDDAFADELSGNIYPGIRPRRPTGPPRGLAGIARKQLFGMAEGGKAELLRNIGGIVGAVREIARQIEGFGVEPFAGYARQASNIVSDMNASLAEKSVEALVEDGRELIRDRPEILVVGAVIAGFIGARLLKARS